MSGTGAEVSAVDKWQLPVKLALDQLAHRSVIHVGLLDVQGLFEYQNLVKSRVTASR